jgi:hypothetical protein
MSKPPPLPAAVLTRVLRITAIDGRVLVFLAGGFALISALAADWTGAIVGGLAAAAGVIELRGRRRLMANDITGVNWLVRSQILLLAIILIYVTYQLVSYNPQQMLDQFEHVLNETQRANGLEVTPLSELVGMTRKEFVAFVKSGVRNSYIAVAVLSILFQGGLAVYYHRKRPALAKALLKS